MPIYEYRCRKCGKYELIHSININADECPTCGGHAVKLISSGYIRMEGIKQDKSPNHPDNVQAGREARKKHTKANTLKEWEAENKSRMGKDGKIDEY